MNANDMDLNEKDILGNSLNTYIFSKNLTERYL